MSLWDSFWMGLMLFVLVEVSWLWGYFNGRDSR